MIGKYSQNFLAGSFISGTYRLVGITTGILYIIKPGGGSVSGRPRPIGKRDPKYTLPEFDWNKDTIKTKHIKVKWVLKPIEVDVIFVQSSVKESDLKAWAKLNGYREVKILFSDEVELLN